MLGTLRSRNAHADRALLVQWSFCLSLTAEYWLRWPRGATWAARLALRQFEQSPSFARENLPTLDALLGALGRDPGRPGVPEMLRRARAARQRAVDAPWIGQ